MKKREAYINYGEKARAVLDALLEKYADEGVLDLENIHILKIPPFSSIGTPIELINAFGGKEQFAAAVHELQAEIYREAA